MRLSATLDRLPGGIERFGYDRAAQAAGIVHFGIGAFHRAHQAWYTDRAMDAGDRDWAITGVSLRSPDMAERLNPQDGLYCVGERSADDERLRLIGAVRSVIVANVAAERVVAALAAPATRIASLTVTEKGYCRAADGALDAQLAGPGTIYPLLAAGLRRRRAARLPGLTLLCCDNLSGNGRQLDRLLREYLDRHDPALVSWFATECACPSTMVDRIVPAVADADRAAVAARLGMEDLGAVVTEPFSQWVIEDRFAGGRPRWEAVGATLVDRVEPYEAAKLRMLNGAHSALAYIGLSHGHVFVHQAVADPAIRPIIERLMRAEAALTITAAPGQDLDRYADDLLARFANPALNHRLAQIAMDGSQKIPPRWLETLAWHRARGERCPAILSGVAAWIRHIGGGAGPVKDPWAAQLADVAARQDRHSVLNALFGPAGLLASRWSPDPVDSELVAGKLA